MLSTAFNWYSSPTLVGQEEHLLAGGERPHHGEHDAADEVRDEVLRRQAKRQTSDAAKPKQTRRGDAEDQGRLFICLFA